MADLHTPLLLMLWNGIILVIFPPVGQLFSFIGDNIYNVIL